jgi:mono/diheme cytochrome c family protein
MQNVVLFAVLLCQPVLGQSVMADPEPQAKSPAPAAPETDQAAGRKLFLKNCAHCHGADAHGDEGPDLHNLDLSDDWIANRIRQGRAGQMTAFDGKLTPSEIQALIRYLHTLK